MGDREQLMPVTSSTTEELFPGNGSQTDFVYTQNTDANANVHVSFIGSGGTAFELTAVTHYDIAGVGGSGGITITYPTAGTPIAPYDVTLTGVEQLAIWVDPPLTTTFNPKNNDVYSPAILSKRVDYIYRNVQRNRELLGRAYHVDIGTADPEATTPPTAGSKVLLAEVTTAADPMRLASVNWPASYDSVELEFVHMRVASSTAYLEVRPLDGTSPVTGLNLSTTYTKIAATEYYEGITKWATNTAQKNGNSVVASFSGSVIFRYVGGFLQGHGMITWLTGFNIVHCAVGWRNIVAAATSWDGFDVHSITTGWQSPSKVRLWGLPKL